MKKLFMAFLAMSFTCCVYSFYKYDKSNSDLVKDEYVGKSQSEMDNLKLKKLSNNLSVSNEPNDNFNTATNLSPDNYYDLSEYGETIYTELDNCDYDYYYFTVSIDSLISFNLSSNQIGDIQLFFIKQDYINSSDTLQQMNEYILNEATGSEEMTSIENYYAKPSTYYISVHNNLPYDDYSCISYELSYSVKMAEEYTLESISDLRCNKACKSVVWESDCLPLGDNSVYDDYGEYTYYGFNNHYCPYKNYLLDSIEKAANGNDILLKSYYIWDVDILKDVFNDFKALKELVNNKIEALSNVAEKYTISIECTKISTTIICKALKLVPGSLPVSIALNTSSNISSMILKTYLIELEEQTKSLQEISQSLDRYLSCFVGLLSQGAIDNSKEGIELKDDFKIEHAIKLNTYYCIKEEEDFFVMLLRRL